MRNINTKHFCILDRSQFHKIMLRTSQNHIMQYSKTITYSWNVTFKTKVTTTRGAGLSIEKLIHLILENGTLNFRPQATTNVHFTAWILTSVSILKSARFMPVPKNPSIRKRYQSVMSNSNRHGFPQTRVMDKIKCGHILSSNNSRHDLGV